MLLLEESRKIIERGERFSETPSVRNLVYRLHDIRHVHKYNERSLGEAE